MSVISAMPAEIVEWLSSQEQLSALTFITEYPPTKKAIPLRKPIVAVGIEKMNITDSFTENDEGVLVENEYCRQAQITIKLSIHAPFSQGGEACHDAFTDIIDCLTFASDLEIAESGCDSIFADRDTDAFVLTARIVINAEFCPAVSSSVSFGSFLNKDLLCGSHITDSTIHMTAAERDKIDVPFIIGSYFGTGAASRTISIGFRPSLVIAFGNQLPHAYADFNEQKTYVMFGIAANEAESMGITLTASGFKLTSGSDYQLRNAVPFLNQLGTTYQYIAFK